MPHRSRPAISGFRIANARRRRPWLAVLCGLLLLTGCEPAGTKQAGGALPNDAYVWQRRWTPAVTGALADGAP